MLMWRVMSTHESLECSSNLACLLNLTHTQHHSHTYYPPPHTHTHMHHVHTCHVHTQIFRLAFGPKSFVVVSDPGYVKQILMTNADNYSKGLLAEILVRACVCL